MGRKISLISSILNFAVIILLMVLIFAVISDIDGDSTFSDWFKKASAIIIVNLIFIIAMIVLNFVSGIMLLVSKNPAAKGLKISTGVLHLIAGTLVIIGMFWGPFAFIWLGVIIALVVVSSLYFTRGKVSAKSAE